MLAADGKKYSDRSSEFVRRDFIKGVGRFAILTPPTVTLLLEVSMNSPAVAASGGKAGGGGETGFKAGGAGETGFKAGGGGETGLMASNTGDTGPKASGGVETGGKSGKGN